MKIRKSLDKVIAIAGGCLVFATGGGGIAAGVAMAGSGASFFNAWREEKEKHGPESERVLEQVRRKIRDEFGPEAEFSLEEQQLLDSADYALGAVLLDSIPPPDRLAAAFGTKEDFAKAAAMLVLKEVAARDDLFAESSEHAQPLARRFAAVVIEAAMATALTNQAYFSRLLPFVLEKIGQDTRETRDDVRAIKTLIEELAGQVAVEQGASIEALREVGLLYGVQAPDASPHDILEALRSAARRMREMDERLVQLERESRRLVNQDNRLTPSLAEAREALTRGELDRADQLIAEALSVYAEILAQQVAEVTDTKRQMAQAYALRAQAAELKFDYSAGVAALREAQALSEGMEALHFAERAADMLMARGYEFGDNGALETAIVKSRGLTAAYYEVEDVDGWRRAMLLLGKALTCLGEREPGTARLGEVVSIYRELLDDLPVEAPESAPFQVSLGNALLRLGERTGGITRFEEAIQAFRASLPLQDREQNPNDLANTHNSLGLALVRLSERSTGTTHLQEAVKVLNLALELGDRRQFPLDWAISQNNLGNALLRLGEREAGTNRLREAVVAFRLVLEEHTQARAPLMWGSAQGNLGYALSRLGEREAGTARLEEAIQAFDAALTEQKRERVPLDWANTQMNRGNALLRWGERELGVERLEAAVATFHLALQELTRERAPFLWAMAQNSLALALQVLGARQEGTDSLHAAVVAIHAALSEWTREASPLLWAMAQNNLGGTLTLLASRGEGTLLFEEAEQAYRNALLEQTRERAPIDWIGATLNLVWTISLRLNRSWDRSALQEALDLAEQARSMAVAANHRPLIDWAATVVSGLEDLERRSAGR